LDSDGPVLVGLVRVYCVPGEGCAMGNAKSQRRGKKSSLDEATGSDLPSVLTAIVVIVLAITFFTMVGGCVYLYVQRQRKPQVHPNIRMNAPDDAKESEDPPNKMEAGEARNTQRSIEDLD